jgi:hypothetical protein
MSVLTKVTGPGIAVGPSAGAAGGIAARDGIGVSDRVVVRDGVEVTVGDKDDLVELATAVDSGVCAVGVGVSVLVARSAGGVTALVGARGVETGSSLSPGRSDTNGATERSFDQ